MFNCFNKGCTFLASSAFQVKKHDSRCRFRCSSQTNSSSNSSSVNESRLPTVKTSLNEKSVQFVDEDHNSEDNDVPLEDIIGSVADNVTNPEIHHDFGSFQEQSVPHIPSFLEEFCGLLLKLSNSSGTKQIQKLINLLQDTSFDLDMFRQHVKSLGSCNNIIESCFDEDVKNAGFQKISCSSELRQNDDTSGTTSDMDIYMRDIKGVLQRQLSYAQKDSSFVFQPTFREELEGDSVSHPLQTKFFRDVYNEVRFSAMNNSEVLSWHESSKTQSNCFVGFLQMFTDKTATTLKMSSMVAYPVHVVFLNCSLQLRRWLIRHGHTLVGFLPVDHGMSSSMAADMLIEDHEHLSIYGYTSSKTVPLSDSIPATSSSTAREKKMKILHSSLRRILSTLTNYSLQGFSMAHSLNGENKVWRCFPTLISYTCDIPEAKDISGVKHGINVTRPCVRCLIAKENFRSLQQGMERSLDGTKMARNSYNVLLRESCRNGSKEATSLSKSKIEEAEKDIHSLSLTKWPSFLENCSVLSAPRLVDMYSIFTFEPLHNLHLGISKLLKECIFSMTSSESLKVKRNGTVFDGRSFKSIRIPLLRSCNSILAAVEKQYSASGLHVDFSRQEQSVQLNGIFTHYGLRGMLEGKDYRSLDMVFPFIVAFIDRVTGYKKEHALTRIHTFYSSVVNELLHDRCDTGWTTSRLSELEKEIGEFKSLVISTFHDHCQTGLYTLKFHLLDHLVHDIRRFGNLCYLDGSPYENFNVRIKEGYNKTSKRKRTRMEETVSVMERTQSSLYNVRFDDIEESIERRRAQLRRRVLDNGSYLVRDGSKVNLKRLESLLEEESSSCNSSHEALFLIRLFGKDTMATFCSLLNEILEKDDFGQIYGDFNMELVQSGYIVGGFLPLLSDCNEDYTAIRHGETYKKTIQRVFASHEFGPSKLIRNSFVLLKSSDGSDNLLWVAKVLLLLRIRRKGNSSISATTGDEYAFVQYMECTKPIDEIDKELGCVCLRWSTDDEVDHTIETSDTNKENSISVGEWFGIEPLSAIRSVVHVIRSNFSVPPFTPELAWPYRRFYINRFYRDHTKVQIGVESHLQSSF